MASPESPDRLRVAEVGDFVPGRPIMVEVRGRPVGVYRVGDDYRAILDFCPHEGIRICKGRVGGLVTSDRPGNFGHERPGEILACPWHGWEFDLQTGQSLHDPRCRLKTFPTEVQDGTVYIRLSSGNT